MKTEINYSETFVQRLITNKYNFRDMLLKNIIQGYGGPHTLISQNYIVLPTLDLLLDIRSRASQSLSESTTAKILLI